MKISKLSAKDIQNPTKHWEKINEIIHWINSHDLESKSTSEEELTLGTWTYNTVQIGEEEFVNKKIDDILNLEVLK